MTSDKSSLEPDHLSGDPLAFAALVRRYQGSLFAYLGRMGLSDALCEELAQETFLRVWNADFSHASDPSQQYEQHESIVRLRQALSTLTMEDREVIAACYTPEIENTQQILNCSEGALRTRLSRARKRLSVALKRLDK